MGKLLGGAGWSFEPAEKGDSKKAKQADNKSTRPKPRMRVENRSGGKTVTVIDGLHYLGAQKIEAIAKILKTACGTGGTVKNGVIELQGDRREEAAAYLKAQGV
mgnify:CR=1 FL=1